MYAHHNRTFNSEIFIQKATPLLGEMEAKTVANQMQLQNYLDTQNYSEYEKLALELYKNSDTVSEKELSTAARLFADQIKNTSSLKTAQIWAEKSVMINENAENTYTLAKLLFLNGKIESAKGYAKLSRILAEKTSLNTQLVDELINKMK